MPAFKFGMQHFENVNVLLHLKKSIVLDANRPEPISGPTYMGSDIGSSLFASDCLRVQREANISLYLQQGCYNKTDVEKALEILQDVYNDLAALKGRTFGCTYFI